MTFKLKIGLLALLLHKNIRRCKYLNPFHLSKASTKSHEYSSKGESFQPAKSPLQFLKQLLIKQASYVCIHTFGLRMMYPGVILKHLIKQALIDGRAKLIEIKRATRNVIHTEDRKCILDTVFVDQRNTTYKNGKYLIICTDGNASFYEVGMFTSK